MKNQRSHAGGHWFESSSLHHKKSQSHNGSGILFFPRYPQKYPLCCNLSLHGTPSEFRLCQDFACGETLVQRKRAAPPRGALSHVRIFPANPRQKATPTGVAFSLRHKLPHTALPPAEPHHSAGGTAARAAACRARAFSRSWKSPRARRSTWEASAPKPGCSAHWARVAG